MILSRRVALNGQNLDDLHGSIVIQGIEFKAPSENIQTINKIGGTGLRVVSQRYESLEVAVKWSMNIPKTNLILRRSVFEAVTLWAMQTGWLTVNYAPGRRLYVDKTILMDPGDLRNWTDEYTITFRAYNVPFWQDVKPIEVIQNSYSGGSFAIYVPGAFRTVADVEFKNTSGSTMNTFSIGVDDNIINLSDLEIANNGTLKITHGTDGLLKIMAGDTSAYSKRSEDSADDLYADPGRANVWVSTQRAGNLKVSIYGRYI